MSLFSTLCARTMRVGFKLVILPPLININYARSFVAAVAQRQS
ncbi:hypothetical protein HMPREF0454_00757 [Hafnia alvei ATCC 51873]|uniref:Uncharacterized protein n=1 Tax=Hafnia alvei ATCC 51873 TaxID=1002364 RepID=G9Y2E3_HAFAL|nr:hypothetical protein HMPREF0454_00757 [Hafnia alvei ATCC 51873]